MTMPYQEANQAISNHSNTVMGTATTSARAKLRLGPKRGSCASVALSASGSFVAIALSIITDYLTLLGSLHQRANNKSASLRRKNSPESIWLPDRQSRRRTSRYPLFVRITELRQLTGILIELLLARDEQRDRVVQKIIYVASRQGPGRRPGVAAQVTALLVLLATPRLAAAQAPNVMTPTQMFDPESAPGIRVADLFILHNETAVEAQYDSNIYNIPSPRKSDVVGLVKSDFRLSTNLPRHQFDLLAGVGVRRYAKVTAENVETYHVGGRAYLDLGERIDVTVDGGIARGYEMRGTSGDQFLTDRPVLYNEKRIHARVERTGGILELALEGSIRTQDYLRTSSNGVPIDLSYRDATVREGHIRANYRLSPSIGVYAQAGANQIAYAKDLGFPRDSRGYTVLGGIHYAVTALVDVEVAAGYIHQSFDAPLTKPVSGINYKLAANWTPTPMWRLTARGERVVDPSPLSNVPAIVRSTFDLRVQRALGDRMLVESAAEYTTEDYRGLGRNDKRFEVSGSVRYRLTKNIGAVVRGGYRKQWGGNFGRSYSGAMASVGVRIVL